MLQQEDKTKKRREKTPQKPNSVLVHSLLNSTCDPFLGNANKNDLSPPSPRNGRKHWNGNQKPIPRRKKELTHLPPSFELYQHLDPSKSSWLPNDLIVPKCVNTKKKKDDKQKNFVVSFRLGSQHTQESFVGFLRTQREPARVVRESTGMFREEKKKYFSFRPSPVSGADDRSVIAIVCVFYFYFWQRPWPPHSI